MEEKIIITAGVILLNTDGDRIVLVRRPLSTKAFPGAWTFPGGKMESGETLSDCAARECVEEAGIKPAKLMPHSFYEHIGPNSRTISHLFIARTNNLAIERDDVKWFSKQDLTKVEIAFGYDKLIDSLLTNSTTPLQTENRPGESIED